MHRPDESGQSSVFPQRQQAGRDDLVQRSIISSYDTRSMISHTSQSDRCDRGEWRFPTLLRIPSKLPIFQKKKRGGSVYDN